MKQLQICEPPPPVSFELGRAGCELQSGTPASRRRICHLSMTLATGGLERLLVDFGRLFDRKRFDLHFLALSELGQPARELAALNCPVVSVGNPASGRLRRVFRLARYLRQHRIELLHTHNTYAHFYGTLAACLAKTRAVINTQHGRGCGDSWKARSQFRLANRFAQRIVGVSRDAASLCRQQDPRSAYKIETIWNGIDLQRFPFHGPQLQNVAICVARLSPEKDFPTLLQATAHVLQQVPDFQLRIVGSGSERSALERLAGELKITEHVQFLGERSDVAELLPSAGLFVSSSRTEGISLTLLEAMAVGLPVVTTRVGGNPEIVVEGETGLLVPAQDPEALAHGLVRMCQDQEHWPAKGEMARRRLERHFDIRNTVRHYDELYSELLDQNERDRSRSQTGTHANDTPEEVGVGVRKTNLL